MAEMGFTNVMWGYLFFFVWSGVGIGWLTSGDSDFGCSGTYKNGTEFLENLTFWCAEGC